MRTPSKPFVKRHSNKWKQFSQYQREILVTYPAHRTYVGGCCGNDAFYFLRPIPAQRSILIDASEDLINVFRTIEVMGPEWFHNQLQFELTCKEFYLDLLDLLRSPHWNRVPKHRRGVLYYWLCQMSFPRSWSYAGLHYVKRKEPIRVQSRGQHTLGDFTYFCERLRTNTELIINDALDELPNWDLPHTYWMVDPSYPNTDPYPGTERLPWEWYEALVEVLAEVRYAKWTLWIELTPEVRELLDSYEISWQRSEKKHLTSTPEQDESGLPASNEIFIKNWGEAQTILF